MVLCLSVEVAFVVDMSNDVARTFFERVQPQAYCIQAVLSREIRHRVFPPN